MNAQLASIPSLVPYTACIESEGVTGIGDDLHIDTRSQKEIMGPRYAEAMIALLSGK